MKTRIDDGAVAEPSGRWRWALAPMFAIAFHLPTLALADETARVTIFAAASLTDVLGDVAKAWHSEGHPEIVLSFAATSALARQIDEGAPADIFASADIDWMKYLVERDRIEASTIETRIGNELVWIAPPGVNLVNEVDPLSLLGDGRLAIGEPNTVPAGKYARQAMMNLGIWEMVKDRLAPAENVRAAMALVEHGEAPLGIVYATDARNSPVHVVAAVPTSAHDTILYPMAIVTGRANMEVKAFYAFMLGPKGLEIFRKYGFTVEVGNS